jgi:hypothetical protein
VRKQEVDGPSQRLSVRKKRLPRDFSDQVIDLELDIDRGTFTIDTVNQLISLYQLAVEYYNGKDDAKYMNWETRMQKLFLKPEILLCMQGK